MFKHRSTLYFVLYEIFIFNICIAELFFAVNSYHFENYKGSTIITSNKIKTESVENIYEDEKKETKIIKKIIYLKKPEITSEESDDADVIWYQEK
jgi:hypothetical protein